ncbi:MAG: CvpA family protein [Bacilli bacterium]|nr:CvpA family protein [Bacilli bacterium]MDD4733488.1 CvpA family protein [Bacilli bacterium]
MGINVLDALIVIYLIWAAVGGWQRGFFYKLVTVVGFILSVVIAFSLKNTISGWLYGFAPFFEFSGALKGVTVMNILLYEVIAFLFVLSILLAIVKILQLFSGFLQGVLNATFIFGIPSKLLGIVLGFIEGYLVVFVVAYFLTLPFFNMNVINQSKYRTEILNSTPVLSEMIGSAVEVADDINGMMTKYKGQNNPNAFNLEALDLFLDKKVVKIDAVDKLIENNKLQINNVDSVLNKYRE